MLSIEIDNMDLTFCFWSVRSSSSMGMDGAKGVDGENRYHMVVSREQSTLLDH